MSDDELSRLAVSETKLDFLIEQMTELRTEVKDLTRQVDQLQRWRAYVLGAGAVVGGLTAFLLKLLKL